MALLNTPINVGIRRYIAALDAFRNFEPVGQLYKVVTDHYEYAGSIFNSGDVIPFDGDGVYLDLAVLERDWNSQLLDPAD